MTDTVEGFFQAASVRQNCAQATELATAVRTEVENYTEGLNGCMAVCRERCTGHSEALDARPPSQTPELGHTHM
eukprot:2234834-Prymnesium_polylepis.1